MLKEGTLKEMLAQTYRNTILCIIKKALRESRSILRLGRTWGSISLGYGCHK